jgi:hypothetical protein
MNCLAHVPKSGPALVRATLYQDGSHESLQLERADLIVKQ